MTARSRARVPPEVANHPESIPVLRCGRCSFARMQAIIYFFILQFVWQIGFGAKFSFTNSLLGLGLYSEWLRTVVIVRYGGPWL